MFSNDSSRDYIFRRAKVKRIEENSNVYLYNIVNKYK